MDTSAGILGVALFLPEIVRSNNWWPSDVVSRWKDHERTPLPVRSIWSVATRVREQPRSASRGLDLADPISPLVGDGATAMILMPWGR